MPSSQKTSPFPITISKAFFTAESRWVGGGPTAAFPDSIVAKNNLIAASRISKTHQVLGGDGGDLCVIGDRPGSKIVGNYITGSPRCLFPDQGAGWWTLENNVLDNGHSRWLNIFFKDTHDLTIEGNYSLTDNVLNHGTNCVVTNHHVDPPPTWSPTAQAIIDAAGIEPAYRDIMDQKENDNGEPQNSCWR